jgi:hypothetical protein
MYGRQANWRLTARWGKPENPGGIGFRLPLYEGPYVTLYQSHYGKPNQQRSSHSVLITIWAI